MRTLTDATLLTIDGPKGAYYAVLDHATGTVLTERTEHAAAALANEKDMVIVDRRQITHAELLRMMTARYEGVAQRPEADQKRVAPETQGEAQTSAARSR